jgi:hypothetical protein
MLSCQNFSVSVPLKEALKKLTDFHENWKEHHSNQGQTKIKFLKHYHQK